MTPDTKLRATSAAVAVLSVTVGLIIGGIAGGNWVFVITTAVTLWVLTAITIHLRRIGHLR